MLCCGWRVRGEDAWTICPLSQSSATESRHNCSSPGAVLRQSSLSSFTILDSHYLFQRCYSSVPMHAWNIFCFIQSDPLTYIMVPHYCSGSLKAIQKSSPLSSSVSANVCLHCSLNFSCRFFLLLFLIYLDKNVYILISSINRHNSQNFNFGASLYSLQTFFLMQKVFIFVLCFVVAT